MMLRTTGRREQQGACARCSTERKEPSVSKEKILVVEDDEDILELISYNLERENYSVTKAESGEDALRRTAQTPPDLILLDLMLPGIDGLEICRQLKSEPGTRAIPIVMVTAKGEESDIVTGLELGADDYVTKPFSIKELLARSEAFMRRRGEEEPEVYEFSNYRLDTIAGTLIRDGKEVELTPGEFKMLHLFLRRAGCTLTSDEVRNAVWGYSRFITLQDIDQAVIALRNKIEPDPNNPTFIHTVEVIGYKFKLPGPNGNDSDN